MNDDSNEIGLSSMPPEILERIFIHLRDRDLLSTSHVCKSFASITEITCAQKYSNEIYKIWGSDKGFQRVMLSKYGPRMSAIQFRWLPDSTIDFVEQKCCNLSTLKLIDAPRIMNLSGLKLASVEILNKECLRNFIENNQQMEKFTLKCCGYQSIEWMEVLHNRLPILKYLAWEEYGNNLTINIPKIALPSLQTLNLFVSQINNVARALHVMDCDNLSELNLEKNH